MKSYASSSIYTTDSSMKALDTNTAGSSVNGDASSGIYGTPLFSGQRKSPAVNIPSYMRLHKPVTGMASSDSVGAVQASASTRQLLSRNHNQDEVLMLAFTGSPPTSTVSRINVLLRRRRFARVNLVGTTAHESSLKRLKLEIYGLAGRIRQELGVYIYLRDQWDDATITDLVHESVPEDMSLEAVVCAPVSGEQDEPSDGVLSMTHAELASTWSGTVGFLHSFARVTIPLLISKVRCRPLFLGLIDAPHTPINNMNATACESLLDHLAETNSVDDLVIGHADRFLLLSPHPSESSFDETDDNLIKRNSYFRPEESFAPGESPTRLWGLWATYNDDVAVV